MVFVTISGTRLPPKTFSECRGKLAARRRIIARGARHLHPCGGAVIADARLDAIVKLQKKIAEEPISFRG